MPYNLNIIGQTHPLHRPDLFREMPAGATVAEIVASVPWDERWGDPVVTLHRGGQEWEVGRSFWHVVRPKAGTDIKLGVPVNDPASLAALGAALIPQASAAAATALGLTAGTLAYTLTVAAISVVAGLALNALIPPPEQPDIESPERSDVFFITGTSNRPKPYQPFPKVYGRHRMFPDPVATGYSETVSSTETYFRGRMTFGYGPVALEDLRIGTTSILEFDDVQLEFRNVDQTETESLISGLASSGIVTAWRTGADWMRLYPEDITEDTYSVQLDTGADGAEGNNSPTGTGTPGPAVVRTTRADTTEASVDITFPQGLGKIANDGDMWRLRVNVQFRYRADGSTGAWTTVGTESYVAGTRDPQRFTKRIAFPSAGTWDVEVQVVYVGNWSDSDVASYLQDTFLTAIRSISPTATALDPDIAEVAFRIKASDQLNGQVDNLNAIVHSMVRTRSGGAWTAPQRTRHPAWHYLDALQGDHLAAADRLADSEIDLTAFEDWASEDPHWTFDYVVRGEQRVADVLDQIAAAGRARRGLIDFKHTVIRDEDSPVRHIFGPRNSWSFRGTITFPKDIHAFRVIVRSEDADWQDDEVMVYADGYSSANATAIETLRLPGTVLTSDDSDQSNAWRLGRYHLAVAELRRETFEWNADWESFLLTRGDRVQVVHDVPVVGVGHARVAAKSGSVLTLDEDFGVSGSHYLKVVESDGTITSLTASGSGQDWTVSAGTLTGVAAGDKVAVYETTQELLNLRITGIFPDTDGSARITAVFDASGVRTADSGTIPGYTPVVGSLTPAGPEQPVVTSAVSNALTTIRDRNGVIRPRIMLRFGPRSAPRLAGEYAQIRWRLRPSDDGTTAQDTVGEWEYGPQQPIGQPWAHTAALTQGGEYEVQARTLSADGTSRGWITPSDSPVVATIDATPNDVSTLVAEASPRAVDLAWTWSPDPEQDLAGFIVRFLRAAASYTITVGSLPASSADAQSEWNAKKAYRPVVNDQAVFSSGGSTATWRCTAVTDASAHTWVLDGAEVAGAITWDAAWEIARPLPTARDIAVQPKAGTYYIKAIDHAGQVSTNAVSDTVAAADIYIGTGDLDPALATVKLTTDYQAFAYDGGGANPEPNSGAATFTATPRMIAVPAYKCVEGRQRFGRLGDGHGRHERHGQRHLRDLRGCDRPDDRRCRGPLHRLGHGRERQRLRPAGHRRHADEGEGGRDGAAGGGRRRRCGWRGRGRRQEHLPCSDLPPRCLAAQHAVGRGVQLRHQRLRQLAGWLGRRRACGRRKPGMGRSLPVLRRGRHRHRHGGFMVDASQIVRGRRSGRGWRRRRRWCLHLHGAGVPARCLGAEHANRREL